MSKLYHISSVGKAIGSGPVIDTFIVSRLEIFNWQNNF